MEKNIYIKDWLEFKPYNLQTKTDNYYLRICNEVRKAIQKQEYFEEKTIDLFSCFITSYFEDLISETNIWNSFVKKHKELYSKPLPFYTLEEYYEGEINHQDVCFLTWYFLNTFQDESFVSPFNNIFIYQIAESVMSIFDKEWEYAPVNEHLKTFYQIDENNEDFYIARNLIDTVLFKTYLFFTDTEYKFNSLQLDIINDYEDESQDRLLILLSENRDSFLHQAHTQLLSLTGKEWVAEILENNKLKKDFLNISKKINGFFLYKGQDFDHIFLEHIASGKKFDLTKKSFDDSDSLKEIDTILYLGIIHWRSEWWFTGVYFDIPFNADLILKEKDSLESRKVVDFLDHQNKETDSILSEQLSAFKEYNNGSQIAFLPSDKIEEFYKGFIDYYNESLNMSENEKSKALKRARKEGFFGTDENQIKFSNVSESGLFFFNPKSGGEIVMSVNSAFPMPTNPYYNEKDSEEAVLNLLFDKTISKELVMYCIDNCKSKLSFFQDISCEAMLEDIDFLLRFWKTENYHSRPSITFTGGNKETN